MCGTGCLGSRKEISSNAYCFQCCVRSGESLRAIAQVSWCVIWWSRVECYGLFLSGRVLRIVVDVMRREAARAVSGVLHCNVLSPLLFLTHFAHLTLAARHTRLINTLDEII